MKTRKCLLVLTALLLIGMGYSQSTIAQPPTEGLKLWLKADDGAMKADPANPGSFIPASVGDAVTLWQDKSGNANNGTAATTWGGTPILTNFGVNKAIRFNANAGFLLADTLAMRLTTLSIYAVVNMDNGAQNQTIIGNYSDVAGYALGMSDGFPDKVKWFTAPSGNTMEPATLLPSDPNFYTILHASYDPAATAVEKVVYFDGQHVAKGSGNGLSYYAASVATVGGLFSWGGQKTKGNICEILVYNAVHPDQYFAVHEYLSQKYGIPVVNDYQGDDPSIVYLKYLFMQSSDDQGVPLEEGQAWNTTQIYEPTYWDLAVLDDTLAHMQAITDPNLIPGHVTNNLINGDIEVELRKGNTYTIAFTGNGAPAGYDLTSDYYSMSFYLYCVNSFSFFNS